MLQGFKRGRKHFCLGKSRTVIWKGPLRVGSIFIYGDYLQAEITVQTIHRWEREACWENA